MTHPPKTYNTIGRSIGFVLLLSTFYSGISFCQSLSYYDSFIGAPHAGMGGTGLTKPGIWSVFHNQAMLGYQNNKGFGISHQNRYLLKEFSLSAAAFVIPVNKATLGISAQYFGYVHFSESKVGLAIGKKLRHNISAGLQFNYISRYIIEQYGSIRQIGLEGGLSYAPVKEIQIGLHFANPSAIYLQKYPTYPLPVLIETGIGYKPAESTHLLAEYVFIADNIRYFRMGIEHDIKKAISFRAGILPGLSTYTLGIGYRLDRLSIHLAFSNQSILGLTPHFSMEYEKY